MNDIYQRLICCRRSARLVQLFSFSFIAVVPTLYNKTILLYFYFIFIAVLRTALL